MKIKNVFLLFISLLLTSCSVGNIHVYDYQTTIELSLVDGKTYDFYVGYKYCFKNKDNYFSIIDYDQELFEFNENKASNILYPLKEFENSCLTISINDNDPIKIYVNCTLPKEYNTTIKDIEYRIIDNKVEKLISYSKPIFERRKISIDEYLFGDKIEIAHLGDLYQQAITGGEFIFNNNGRYLFSNKIDSEFVELVINEDYSLSLLNESEKILVNEFIDNDGHSIVITTEQYDFDCLTNFAPQTKLYGVINEDNIIKSLYAFNK